MNNNYRRTANNIRFSCAYLFRICVNGKYLLVKDEQGRDVFQPVGGVYKYYDDTFFSDTHAVQCTRFENKSDLDCDLRVIVPRKYVGKFKRWYKKETGRETPDNLYREFKEEIIDRIPFFDFSAFETITYRFCGENVEIDRLGERDMQIRFADVVELQPTPEQTNVLLDMLKRESDVYRFATKEEIYNIGRVAGNQVQSISPHAQKILPEEENQLIRTKRSGKYYTCSCEEEPVTVDCESWEDIEKADITKPYTFISYNSLRGKDVWDFCADNMDNLKNLWIDRKQTSENWKEDVEIALGNENCKKAIIFISREYLLRSTPCYYETSLIVKNKIPHVVVLLDADEKFIKQTIKDWIFCDEADKDKLRSFKRLFCYDDDSGHLDCSMFTLKETDLKRMWQAYNNL